MLKPVGANTGIFLFFYYSYFLFLTWYHSLLSLLKNFALSREVHLFSIPFAMTWINSAAPRKAKKRRILSILGSVVMKENWIYYYCKERYPKAFRTVSEPKLATTATEAWSWILIGRENEVRYASQSGSETTDKRRLSIDSSNPIFYLEYKSLVFSWGTMSTTPRLPMSLLLLTLLLLIEGITGTWPEISTFLSTWPQFLLA